MFGISKKKDKASSTQNKFANHPEVLSKMATSVAQAMLRGIQEDINRHEKWYSSQPRDYEGQKIVYVNTYWSSTGSTYLSICDGRSFDFKSYNMTSISERDGDSFCDAFYPHFSRIFSELFEKTLYGSGIVLDSITRTRYTEEEEDYDLKKTYRHYSAISVVIKKYYKKPSLNRW